MAPRAGRATGAALVAVVALAGACGDDDDEALRPLIEEIPAAVEALETELGEVQVFYEINATPQLVNLFVADRDAGTVVPYVYAGGELQEPGPARPVSGGTPFAAADVVEDLTAVLEGVTDELPGSNVSVFVVFPDDAGAPAYGATVVSDEGGVLDVDLSPSGEVLAVDPGA